MKEQLMHVTRHNEEIQERFPKGSLVTHSRLPLIGIVQGYATSVGSPTIDLLSIDNLMCYENRDHHEKGRGYLGGLWNISDTYLLNQYQIRELDPDNVTGYGE